MTLRAAALALSLVLSLAACGGSDTAASSKGSATMRPGEDCMASGCHATFTAAGTVYASSSPGAAVVEGATVEIDGSRHITMTTNSAGNFWTTDPFGTGTVAVSHGGTPARMLGTITERASCSASTCHGGASYPGRVHP